MLAFLAFAVKAWLEKAFWKKRGDEKLSLARTNFSFVFSILAFARTVSVARGKCIYLSQEEREFYDRSPKAGRKDIFSRTKVARATVGPSQPFSLPHIPLGLLVLGYFAPGHTQALGRPLDPATGSSQLSRDTLPKQRTEPRRPPYSFSKSVTPCWFGSPTRLSTQLCADYRTLFPVAHKSIGPLSLTILLPQKIAVADRCTSTVSPTKMNIPICENSPVLFSSLLPPTSISALRSSLTKATALSLCD